MTVYFDYFDPDNSYGGNETMVFKTDEGAEITLYFDAGYVNCVNFDDGYEFDVNGCEFIHSVYLSCGGKIYKLRDIILKAQDDLDAYRAEYEEDNAEMSSYERELSCPGHTGRI